MTAFEFRLHPLTQVVGGLAAHPVAKAKDVLRFFRDLTQSLPDELVVFAGLTCAPGPERTPVAALVCCHCGSAEQAARDLAPIHEFGPPVMDHVGPMPYPAINQMLDAAAPKGALNYWKSAYLEELSDDVIDLPVDQYARNTSPMTLVLIEHIAGAVTRIPADATAFPHREPGYNLNIATQWLDSAETDVHIAWTRACWTAVQPHLRDAAYVNYLGDDDPAERVASAYGANYDRLREMKRRYDPENRFHLNQNIPPA